MSEHMSPIPSRIYNAAVGGHVAGSDQIIDDETGLTLDKVTGGALEEKTYISGSDNGMGRVVLRKNLVEGVNTLTQTMINKSNTIYVIQYDFTLGEDITVPANCVLEFDGGSISGENTLTFNNTYVFGVKCFGNTLNFAGNIANDVIDLSIFRDNSDPLDNIQKLIGNYDWTTHTGATYNSGKKFIVPKGNYSITKMLAIAGVSDVEIDFCGSTVENAISDLWSYRVNTSTKPIIYLVDCHDIKIHDLKYTIDSSTIIEGKGKTGIISGNMNDNETRDYIGVYNIELYNIVGDTTNLSQGGTNLDAPIGFASFIGESYNISVHDVIWNGLLSTLFNFEYYFKPIESDKYGAYPHNIDVYNIEAFGIRNAQSSTNFVVVRLSGVYNGHIRNVYTYDCDTSVYIYNSDDGIARTSQNLVVENINAICVKEHHVNKRAIDCVITYENGNQGYTHPSFVNHDLNVSFINCVVKNANEGIIFDNLGDSVSIIKDCLFENCENAVAAGNPIGRNGSLHIEDSYLKNCTWGIGVSNSNIIVKNTTFEDNKDGNNQREQVRVNYRYSTKAVIILDGCLFKYTGSNLSRPTVHFVNLVDPETIEVDRVSIKNCVFYNGTITVPSVLIDDGFIASFSNNVGKYITGRIATVNKWDNEESDMVELPDYIANYGGILNTAKGTKYIKAGSPMDTIRGVINKRNDITCIRIMKKSYNDIEFVVDSNVASGRISLPYNNDAEAEYTKLTVKGHAFIELRYVDWLDKWTPVVLDSGNTELVLS